MEIINATEHEIPAATPIHVSGQPQSDTDRLVVSKFEPGDKSAVAEWRPEEYTRGLRSAIAASQTPSAIQSAVEHIASLESYLDTPTVFDPKEFAALERIANGPISTIQGFDLPRR